jgi:hypothetical protein
LSVHIDEGINIINDSHIQRFQRRSRMHLLVSYIILLIVGFLFCVTGYVFIYAQTIDNQKGSVSALLEIQDAIANQQTIIADADVEVSGLKQEATVGQRTTNEVLVGIVNYFDAKTKLGVFKEKQKLLTDGGYFSEIDSNLSKEELEAERVGIEALQHELDAQLTKTEGRFKIGEVTQTDLSQVKRTIDEQRLKMGVVVQESSIAKPANEITKAANTLI